MLRLSVRLQKQFCNSRARSSLDMRKQHIASDFVRSLRNLPRTKLCTVSPRQSCPNADPSCDEPPRLFGTTRGGVPRELSFSLATISTLTSSSKDVADVVRSAVRNLSPFCRRHFVSSYFSRTFFPNLYVYMYFFFFGANLLFAPFITRANREAPAAAAAAAS